MLAVAVFVRVKLGKPILFKQERSGLDGKTFIIRKFRVMTEKRDANGELLPDNRRLSKFGATSIYLKHEWDRAKRGNNGNKDDKM